MKKNRRFFERRLQKREIFVIFWRFRLNLGVFHASAEGAREKFRVFYRGTAYDVIIFKFQGGAFAPPAPLLTPMCGDIISVTLTVQSCSSSELVLITAALYSHWNQGVDKQRHL